MAVTLSCKLTSFAAPLIASSQWTYRSILAINQATNALKKVYPCWNTIAEALSTINPIVEISQESSAGAESMSGQIAFGKMLTGKIEFCDVRFAYPSRPDIPVLDGLSMAVAPGTMVAIVGSSGAGKSTVIALLEKWFTLNSGQILVDGVDIDSLQSRSFRRSFGLVQQVHS